MTMTFREALAEHVQAIQQRDLRALAETVSDDELILITADGALVRAARNHRLHPKLSGPSGWVF
jgi:hypothetical protein